MTDAEWNELKAICTAEALYRRKRAMAYGLDPELWEAMSRDPLVAREYDRLVLEAGGGRSYTEAEVESVLGA